MPRQQKSTYLGTLLTDSLSHKAELNNRIADVIQTANKLKLFWDKADTPTYWKLRDYESVIRSKLMYGLATIELTNAELNKLDTFQIRGIRIILGVASAFVERENTNDNVGDLFTKHLDQAKSSDFTSRLGYTAREGSASLTLRAV